MIKRVCSKGPVQQFLDSMPQGRVGESVQKNIWLTIARFGWSLNAVIRGSGQTRSYQVSNS